MLLGRFMGFRGLGFGMVWRWGEGFEQILSRIVGGIQCIVLCGGAVFSPAPTVVGCWVHELAAGDADP